jgi:hypothetical protein
MQHDSMLPVHWMLHRTHGEEFDLVLANPHAPWQSTTNFEAAVKLQLTIERTWRAAKCPVPSASASWNVEAWLGYACCRMTPWVFALDWDLFARHHLSPTSTAAHDAHAIEALQWMSALLPGPTVWRLLSDVADLVGHSQSEQVTSVTANRLHILPESTSAPILPVFHAASLHALLERAVHTFYPRWWSATLDRTILSWWQELPPGCVA